MTYGSKVNYLYAHSTKIELELIVIVYTFLKQVEKNRLFQEKNIQKKNTHREMYFLCGCSFLKGNFERPSFGYLKGVEF